jgi:DNA primase
MNNLPAYKYLITERGLTPKIIRDFHLSYCDSRGQIYTDADMTLPFPELDFRFRNSSLFPIFNLYSTEVVGISARPLTPKPDLPKYINTSYEKSEHLYGLNLAWKDLIQEREVYIVEGNLDVIMCRQKGINNVVGLLGSNFSVVQLGLLIGFCEKIKFVLDGDMAGLNFMEKLKGMLIKRYKDVPVSFYFKFLPFDGNVKVDPDSYLKEHTKEEFLALPEVKV